MLRYLLALVVLVLGVSPVGAQAPFTPDPVDLAAAKKEGQVSWYTSTPIVAAQKIATLFQAETGIRSSCSAPAAPRCSGASSRRSTPSASWPTS
jgi:hypothetical protein